MDTVHPIVPDATGRIQVTGLQGGVAVRLRHGLPQGDEDLMVDGVHVQWDISIGIAVGPQDQLAVGMERDSDADIGMIVHKIAQGLGLRLGEGIGASIDLAGSRTAGARSPPGIVIVAVGVHAIGPIAVVTSVLAPPAIGTTGDVVFPAVGIGIGEHVDLARVHQLGHPAQQTIVVSEILDYGQAHLHGQVLAGVVMTDIEHLGFVLVNLGVVADLHHPQIASLPGLADTEQIHDVPMISDGPVEFSHRLGEVVIVRVLGRKVQQSRQRFDGIAELAQLVDLPGRSDGDNVAFAHLLDGHQVRDPAALLARGSVDAHRLWSTVCDDGAHTSHNQ